MTLCCTHSMIATTYLVTIALKVVVKGQLSVGWYGLGGEQANGKLTALHHPLLSLTIGLTGVVDESTQCTLHDGMHCEICHAW